MVERKCSPWLDMDSIVRTRRYPIGIDDELLLQLSELIPDFPTMVEKARRASRFEHERTNRKAFTVFP
jgi:SP family general alpha glucoside:H+ symporter-like MFS transporter